MNLSLGFIEGIGGPELMMIMFIILLLFGANKLPELARGLGKSVKEFKKAASGVEEEVRRAMEEPPTPPPAPPKPVASIQPVSPEKSALPPPAAAD
jgi:sec-independent protein translocase protein TatA